MNKKILIFIITILSQFTDGYGQNNEDSVENTKPLSSPFSIYMTPVRDGAAFALEYSIKKNLSINMYVLNRKADGAASSSYYGTKYNESLYELFFKYYLTKKDHKKMKLFFGPCVGFKKITFDENFFFFEDFGPGSSSIRVIDAKAKAKFIVPMYFGFDYKSKRGLIFEYTAGISFQNSEGNTNIRGPLISPYGEGVKIRSRFLFGYSF